MHFTQEQAREIARIPPETLRHWRKAVPYLSAKRGKSARFTFVELLGLAVLRLLTASLGIQIGAIGPAVDAMFSILRDLSVDGTEDLILRITKDQAQVASDSLSVGASDQAAIIVPLAPLLTQLQRAILPIVATAPQRALRFPPESVRRHA